MLFNPLLFVIKRITFAKQQISFWQRR